MPCLVFTVEVLLDDLDLSLEPEPELVLLDELVDELLQSHLLLLQETSSQIEVIQINLIGIFVRKWSLLNLLNLWLSSALPRTFLLIGIKLRLIIILGTL